MTEDEPAHDADGTPDRTRARLGGSRDPSEAEAMIRRMEAVREGLMTSAVSEPLDLSPRHLVRRRGAIAELERLRRVSSDEQEALLAELVAAAWPTTTAPSG